MQKFVPRRRVGVFRDEDTRSTPLDPKHMFGVFCTILVHLGPLGCLTKLGAKWAELVQKFVPRSRVGVTNAPDTPHWTLNSCFGELLNHLGAFGIVWLLYETRYKTG